MIGSQRIIHVETRLAARHTPRLLCCGGLALRCERGAKTGYIAWAAFIGRQQECRIGVIEENPHRPGADK